MKLFERKKYPDGFRKFLILGIPVFSYINTMGMKKIYVFNKNIFSLKKSFTLCPDKCPYNKMHAFKDNPNEYIKSLGVKMGENVTFIIYPYPFSYPVFGSEPYLIEFGSNILVSYGVNFITHDLGTYALKNAFGLDLPLKCGKITVKDGVFIGCNSIIMPGVTIGKNSIIGAGSVVTKNVGDNEIWAGNPAKFIKTLEDYKNKVTNQNN